MREITNLWYQYIYKIEKWETIVIQWIPCKYLWEDLIWTWSDLYKVIEQKWEDILEKQEFYELLQSYRHSTDILWQTELNFKVIKNFIRKYFIRK